MSTDTIVSVADSLATHLPAEEAFKALGRILRNVYGIDRLSLAMYDQSHDDFAVVAVELDSASKYGSGVRLPREGTRVGDAFKSMRPKLGNDLRFNQRYQEDHFLAAEGMQTGLTLPLIIDGSSIGALNIDWREKAALNEREVELFFALADVIARSPSIVSWVPVAEKRSGGNMTAEDLVSLRPSLRRHVSKLKKYAASGASILLHGETGTGKGVLARALHNWSKRASSPFIKCDCSALTNNLIESDLFGHERGAFTGATKQRIGRFELATGGTIFLDEIGEFTSDLQPKLLSVIEDQELIRVGGSRVFKIDVRIIAATNRDLLGEIAEKRFRRDLYHRLCVLELEVPPLRKCPDDIPILTNHIVNTIAARAGVSPPIVDKAAVNALMDYHWPGNVRELGNVLERAILLSEGPVLSIKPDMFGSPPKSVPTGMTTLAEVEAWHITSVLEARNWRVSGNGGAAEILGMHPNTLRSRMEKLGLKRPLEEHSAAD